MRRHVRLSLISFLLIVVNATLVDFITIGNAVPDILLIWIVYVAVTQGQLAATLYGFFIGLGVDLIAGDDGMLGLSTFVKTLAGFLAGYFFNDNKIELTLSSWKFVVAVGLCTLLHNGIYFLIFLRGSEISWWHSIAWYGVPSMLYTTALTAVPMSLFRRRYQ